MPSERQHARFLIAKLRRRPTGRQLELVHADGRFQSAALVDLLLERCREIWSDETARAEEFAKLAFEVADRIDPSSYGSRLKNNLLARASAYVGNTRRIQYDLRSAAELFGEAERYLAKGDGDPLARALIFHINVPFLRANGDSKKRSQLSGRPPTSIGPLEIVIWRVVRWSVKAISTYI